MGSKITAFILPDVLPGEQWTPSNGTVGYSFVAHNCGDCERNRNDDCDILSRSFRGEAVEWRSTEEGQFCMAYAPLGECLPETPDPLTLCMDFAALAAQVPQQGEA